MSISDRMARDSQRQHRVRISAARRALVDLAIELVEQVDARPEDPFGVLDGIFDRMRKEVEALRQEDST